jgi:hypothetical protein
MAINKPLPIKNKGENINTTAINVAANRNLTVNGFFAYALIHSFNAGIINLGFLKVLNKVLDVRVHLAYQLPLNSIPQSVQHYSLLSKA